MVGVVAGIIIIICIYLAGSNYSGYALPGGTLPYDNDGPGALGLFFLLILVISMLMACAGAYTVKVVSRSLAALTKY